MNTTRNKLDVILAVYNEEACLGELLNRLLELQKKMSDVEFTFIFVNDGSTDASAGILQKFATQHQCVRVLNFSRNFGHQMAVTAGLDYCDADYVAILDADLQDPPELIENMYRQAQTGIDIVYGKRIARRGESLFKQLTAYFFYRVFSRLCEMDVPADTGDFRLISRRVVNSLRAMREKKRFLRGMIPWTGFSARPCFYHRDKRFAGTSKYSLYKMLRFALDAIFSFSNAPVRLVSYTGIILAVSGFCGGLILLLLKMLAGYSGSTIWWVGMLLLLLVGIQIFMLGIIGEYVGRIFQESMNRPLYIVESSHNFPESAIGLPQMPDGVNSVNDRLS